MIADHVSQHFEIDLFHNEADSLLVVYDQKVLQSQILDEVLPVHEEPIPTPRPTSSRPRSSRPKSARRRQISARKRKEEYQQEDTSSYNQEHGRNAYHYTPVCVNDRHADNDYTDIYSCHSKWEYILMVFPRYLQMNDFSSVLDYL
jgi:hypothetical protein